MWIKINYSYYSQYHIILIFLRQIITENCTQYVLFDLKEFFSRGIIIYSFISNWMCIKQVYITMSLFDKIIKITIKSELWNYFAHSQETSGHSSQISLRY